MPATTRDALIAVTEREYAKLSAAIEPIPDDVALATDADGISIKDVVAHRAHWLALFARWYADGMAGKTVHFPDEGYKWNELPRYNADLRARQAGLSWAQAKALLAERHQALLAFLRDRDDAELYGAPMQGAHNDWTPGRWAEAAGPSHYRSATKYIRARLGEAGRKRAG